MRHAWFFFILPIILCTLSGCERSTEWEITPDHGERLVVEAILTDELRTQEIRLSTTFDTLNTQLPGVSNAMVSVSAGFATYVFDPEPQKPGLYRSRVPFRVIGQLTYVLDIEWKGDQYTAQSTLSEVAPIPEIQFDPVDTIGHFTINDNVVPVFNDAQQAMYQFDLNWSHLQPDGQNTARLFYYTFNTVHISEFLRPGRDDVVFPAGTIAVISKYGLNDDYAEYLRSLVIETYWNGNWFFGNPENQPTNLSNGAIGFFTTCAVLREIVIVQ